VGGELLEQTGDSTSQVPDPAGTLVAALQRQNLDRLAQPLADHGYHGARHRIGRLLWSCSCCCCFRVLPPRLCKARMLIVHLRALCRHTRPGGRRPQRVVRIG
jgi:hypothetical protein